ncbi:glycosyl transferase, group 1 [Methanospirillum hungatei JF-1]|jgi:glycosyltransferase involved in cell wall biosynthesis|uniref:Glycosyl transferase, group 1 n=1 Tax=Methanospirillum hungatei JF-1 (strain ATCC 27890 / DSM 864 / NBRC 100397 / JF-1) TaxID=323259 RepID=Q2FN97_METHJ|nr:glycosyltransferase [Methanospirillum hungatei]ABD41831.1 glycosyl transferase, group 1 [Methanospirillum hungatei JF-1]
MKNREIGIAIGFLPGELSIGEGLARLLSFIIKGLIENRIQITLLSPEWAKSDLEKILKDIELHNSEFISIITTGKIPLIFNFKRRLESLFLNREKRYRNKENSKSIKPFNWAEFFLDRITKFCAKIPFLIQIILIPIFYCIYFSFILLNDNKNLLYKSNRIGTKNHYNPDKKISKRKVQSFYNKLSDEIINCEYKKLCKIAQKNERIKSWIIPTLFWPLIVEKIPNPIVIAPDIVFSAFPVGFELSSRGYNDSDHYVKMKDHFQLSLNFATQIITYSDYVKNQQVCKFFNIDDKKVSVIPHGHISLSDNAYVREKIQYFDPNFQREKSVQIIMNYLEENNLNQYKGFIDTKFIMFTSQIRPHKNILNLVKAIYKIRDEKHIFLKLILTADFSTDAKIMKTINKYHLETDIIQFTRISSQLMAALYNLASIAVNPSLAEGGFPFTFSEAYSVGTPSIMSKIPVVEEYILDPNLKDIMLFDPYDITDMVNKIIWGVFNRDLLFKLQEPLFSKSVSRSWKKVAEDYYNITQKL